MQSVVTLLDDQHYARVEAIWEELCQKFGVRGMYVTAYPHFSYQVAEKYDEAACDEAASVTRGERGQWVCDPLGSPTLRIPTWPRSTWAKAASASSRESRSLVAPSCLTRWAAV